MKARACKHIYGGWVPRCVKLWGRRRAVTLASVVVVVIAAVAVVVITVVIVVVVNTNVSRRVVAIVGLCAAKKLWKQNLLQVLV